MAEPNTTPPTETNASPKGEVTFAGKFKTPEALETGYREVRKTIAEKHGLDTIPDNAVLVGDKGLFKDHAALEAAYKKTERLVGVATEPPKNKAETPPKDAGLGIKPNEVPLEDEDVDLPATVSKAGLKMDELEKQFAEHGKLTDEQYAAIKKVRPGMSKRDINDVAEGLAAKGALRQRVVTELRGKIVEMVGGEQQLETLRNEEVAKEYLTPAEIKDFNRRIEDPALALGAYSELNRRYAAHVQKGGNGGSPVAGDGIRSTGPIKSAAEFRELSRKSAMGDAAATARIMATPNDVLESLS